MIRRALIACCAALFAISGVTAATAQVAFAEYTEPTTRYDHGVLGDAVEWGAVRLRDEAGGRITFRLPENMVFEDVVPRVVDVTGDGRNEVVTVESHLEYGARLAIYDQSGRIAATPFIGRSHRWLAPIGAADLEGDGAIEIAYIDRPHLAKVLRVWRLDGGDLVEVAAAAGFSNHRIGWDFIAGGLRDCGDGPEMVLASGDWRRVVAVRLDRGALSERELGAYEGVESLDRALDCEG